MQDAVGFDTAEPPDQRRRTSPVDLLRPLLQGEELVRDFLASESYTKFFESISDMTHLTTMLKDRSNKQIYLYFYPSSVYIRSKK